MSILNVIFDKIFVINLKKDIYLTQIDLIHLYIKQQYSKDLRTITKELIVKN